METKPLNIPEWLNKEKHLPPFLRDFHDQKDFFKAMHDYFSDSFHKTDRHQMPNWADGHVYTIDYLLRFLAAHGWTLQKNKSKLEFCDIDQTINEYKEKIIQSMKEFFEKGRQG